MIELNFSRDEIVDILGGVDWEIKVRLSTEGKKFVHEDWLALHAEVERLEKQDNDFYKFLMSKVAELEQLEKKSHNKNVYSAMTGTAKGIKDTYEKYFNRMNGGG